jgi:hypothetical protein
MTFWERVCHSQHPQDRILVAEMSILYLDTEKSWSNAVRKFWKTAKILGTNLQLSKQLKWKELKGENFIFRFNFFLKIMCHVVYLLYNQLQKMETDPAWLCVCFADNVTKNKKINEMDDRYRCRLLNSTKKKTLWTS